jgi:alkylation response protein AidB-like acyl-CoA dehydrogenase
MMVPQEMKMDTMIVDRVLPEDMLNRFAERVGTYDRENRFFKEDFEDLKRAGYLTINVPKEMGGRGFTLAEVCREQRRLAYYAPATALGINMHLYWIGVAADLWRAGDRSLEWMLREAAAGEIFAAGHAERGNDIPVLLSTAVAKKVDGGFTFTGRKMFGSLAPVWTRYGMHGVWADAPGGPQVVHGFLPRNATGYRIIETWDTLGMRATRSDDVLLEGALVPDKYVARTLPAGGADAFVVAVFAWALMGFANVYYGMAERARDLVLPTIKAKSSMGLTRSLAYHPGIQQGVADLVMALDPIGPHLEQVAHEWATGVDHGAAWPARIISAKVHAVEACWKIVDLAMELSGGTGMFKSSELERLFRDARCGRFHPANAILAHEIIGKTALGIGLDEQPRWG